MEGDTTLYLKLHKLSAINSEEPLDDILLNLPSPSQVDPVLACLRSLIRKCVHENFTSDDLLKLFPPDLPFDLQSTLILLLQKYQSQWKEGTSSSRPAQKKPKQ